MSRIILCCPVLHHDECFGFIEVDAPVGSDDLKCALSQRDLALATLVGHLVAAKLQDLKVQGIRLQMARKATAGFLAATVGHCFKNLLTVPQSLNQMIPAFIEKGDAEGARRILGRATVYFRILNNLSNEFAAVSKDPKVGRQVCNLVPILNEVADLVNRFDPNKMKAVVKAPREHFSVEVQPAALNRLLLNLTLNALEAIYNESSEKKGLIELELESDSDTNQVYLRVRDNGPGIKADILNELREIFEKIKERADALEQLEQIAEKVQRVHSRGMSEHYGLGFLFVCQTIHQHDGDLVIESEPGQGTCFTVILDKPTPLP